MNRRGPTGVQLLYTAVPSLINNCFPFYFTASDITPPSPCKDQRRSVDTGAWAPRHTPRTKETSVIDGGNIDESQRSNLWDRVSPKVSQILLRTRSRISGDHPDDGGAGGVFILPPRSGRLRVVNRGFADSLDSIGNNEYRHTLRNSTNKWII